MPHTPDHMIKPHPPTTRLTSLLCDASTEVSDSRRQRKTVAKPRLRPISICLILSDKLDARFLRQGTGCHDLESGRIIVHLTVPVRFPRRHTEGRVALTVALVNRRHLRSTRSWIGRNCTVSRQAWLITALNTRHCCCLQGSEHGEVIVGGNPPCLDKVAKSTLIVHNLGTYCVSIEISLSNRQRKTDLALQCAVT